MAWRLFYSITHIPPVNTIHLKSQLSEYQWNDLYFLESWRYEKFQALINPVDYQNEFG